MERNEVYQRIDTERDYQDLRWDSEKNDGAYDNEKDVAEWINYIEYHIHAAKNQIYNSDKEEALAHIRKIAALSVRTMEVHGCPKRVIPKELIKEKLK